MGLYQPSMKRKFPLLLIGFILFTLSGMAQLTADFKLDKNAGCSPLTVTFTNKTTGASGAATYSWDFGNGNTVSTTDAVTAVGATYFISKIYTVTLTVHDGAQTSTKSAVITVFKGPVVDYTYSNPTGCLPLTTSFTSTASAGDGSIVSYFWDFGDGNTIVTGSSSVTNTYQFAGSYSVSLTVTNSNGCSNTLKKLNIVTVMPQITPGFSSDSTTLCNISDPVQFNNFTTGTGPLSYAWNFGDGANSGSQNPSHQYAAIGTYSVGLTVTNPYGCSATLTKPAYVNAANFKTDFTTTPTLCTSTVITFKDNSVPTATGATIWDFGDGGSAIGSSATHTYATPGSYTVQLIDTFGKCVVMQPKTINVASSPVLGNFAFDKGAACSSPMLVAFTDKTPAPVTWHWNFTGNPGDTSDLQNPSFLYPTNGTYLPRLTVTNASGCSSSVSEPLNSGNPTATIHADTTLSASAVICAIVNAQFTAISQDTIGAYSWTFGDGSTSTSPNPTHSYTVAGTYIVNLNFVTIHGCAGTAFPPDTIRVYPKPHAIFTALDSLPCANNQAEVFTNLDDSSFQNQWIYGDGSTDINNNVYHVHNYAASGNYTMTLIASSPGCAPDTYTITRFVKTTPLPTLTATNTCDTPRMSVTLANATPGASQYVWSFGDGSPDETDLTYLPSKTHIYPKDSAYTAKITATFGTCIQVATTPVFVLPVQHPVLSSTAITICQNGNLPVTISRMDSNYRSIAAGAGTNYYSIVGWQYDDLTVIGPQGNTGFKTTYNGSLTKLKQGIDSIRVITQSVLFGCYDTSNFIPIHVNGPQADFTALDNVCYTTPVIFTDASVPTNGNPITQWVWSFGDGNSVTRSTGDTVMHNYAFPGNYAPSLTVTDSLSCSATITKSATKIKVLGSKADFYWNPTNIAPGSPVTFFNSSITNAGATFQWFFKFDGATSTNPNQVIHTFTNIGYDTVTLIASATTAGTCSDTSRQLVIVNNLAASFVYTTEYIDKANCPPMLAHFVSTTKNAVSLHWDFGDGATADNNPNPNHTYNLPGLYTITLTAYGANGLSTSSQDTLTVKGPYATLYSSLLQACIPAIDTLHATVQYASSYTWDFGDGTIINNNDTLATHEYIVPGLFTPALIMTDLTGCQVTIRYDKQLLMDTLHASPEPPLILCDTGAAHFAPTILSWVRDNLGMPLKYHWDFGTGSAADTANIASPTFKYLWAGDFIASLNVASPIGCQSSMVDTIHVIPPIGLSYQQDTAICPGNFVPLHVTGADTYQWLPADGLDNVNGGNATGKPDVTTVYTVIGQDKDHCFTDTALLKVIVNPVPTVTINPTTTLLAGSSAIFTPVGSADVISWNWTPPNRLTCVNCQTPTVVAPDEITYRVTVANAEGCTAFADVTIKLLCTENSVHIPNAFSPNNDGNNDLFYPGGSGVKLIRYFQVYSRWGQLLFSKKDFQVNDHAFGWDGTLNGIAQPAGTYVYMVQAECYTGETFVLKGTVELLR